MDDATERYQYLFTLQKRIMTLREFKTCPKFICLWAPNHVYLYPESESLDRFLVSLTSNHHEDSEEHNKLSTLLNLSVTITVLLQAHFTFCSSGIPEGTWYLYEFNFYKLQLIFLTDLN